MDSQAQLPLTQEELQKLVEGVLGGVSVAEAVNMSKDDLENLYALAYSLYTSANYKDAETVFQALCVYDTREYRFWMGLAGCRQALEKYKTAVDAYQMAALAASLNNPEPFFYAAKCLLKQNMKEEAIAVIQALFTMGEKSDPKVAKYHAKGQALLELLQKKE